MNKWFERKVCNLTPFFPAKSFVIKLDGTKGDEDATWRTDYAQDGK